MPVSMRSSLATWLTHAEISATAGRRARSTSSPPPVTGGGAALLTALHRRQDLAGDPTLTVAVIDAAALGQLVERQRLALGDAEHGEVGEHLAHRHVERLRLPFAPLRQRLSDGAGASPQRADVLQAAPGILGVDRPDRSEAQLLARRRPPTPCARARPARSRGGPAAPGGSARRRRRSPSGPR